MLAASRERNRFRSIVWDEYDSVHQKYLEIGMYQHFLKTLRTIPISKQIKTSGISPALIKTFINLFYNLPTAH